MEKICIVGLGYVGLPLAVEFGKKQKVTGFDVNQDRIAELKRNIDSSNEISAKELKKAGITFSAESRIIKKATFIIVAVPTPITQAKIPDLMYLRSASKTVGQNLSKGAVVVFESTVYPGATEEVCVPILEKQSNLKCGLDFKIAYSPERINPGDHVHTVDKIVKVISGMDKDTIKRVKAVYESVVKAGVFTARDIKTAEAAKVIENIQRDLNIALMNELSLIFNRLGISTKDVLDAAGTKWNFHRYHPGLVGGHCIGVDPYYLTYKAQVNGYQPQIILAGRNINEYMSKHVADLAIECMGKNDKPLRKSNVLLLGLTFKENVSDYRNTKSKDLIAELKKKGVNVIACEPLLGKRTVKEEFGIKNIDIDRIKDIDCAIMISPHDEFKSLTLKKLKILMNSLIMIDIPSFYNRAEADKLGFAYRSL